MIIDSLPGAASTVAEAFERAAGALGKAWRRAKRYVTGGRHHAGHAGPVLPEVVRRVQRAEALTLMCAQLRAAANANAAAFSRGAHRGMAAARRRTTDAARVLVAPVGEEPSRTALAQLLGAPTVMTEAIRFDRFLSGELERLALDDRDVRKRRAPGERSLWQRLRSRDNAGAIGAWT